MRRAWGRTLAAAPLLAGVLVSAASATPATPSRPGSLEVNVTNGAGAGEPELAIDPVHHTLVISFDATTPPGQAATPDGGHNQVCGVAVSANRGQTWRVRYSHPADAGPTPNDPYHQCSDPTAAAGPGGVVYAGAGWWDTPSGTIDYYNMRLARSNDGGHTWSRSVFATGDQNIAQNAALGTEGHSDREFVTVDNKTGVVYVSAVDIYRLRRWIIASHDGGKTFGALHPIDSSDFPEAGGDFGPNTPIGNVDYIPAAGNGKVAVSYIAAGVPGLNNCPCNIFETSTDDGATWARHFTPVAAQWTAADLSHPGRYAIMSGQGITASTSTPDYLAVSTTSDYGKTWSKPVRIGQGPPNQRWQPWIAYSPTGVLGVGYKTEYVPSYPGYSYPNATYTNSPYDYWAAVSFDGGRSFSAPIRLSHATSAGEGVGGNGDDFSTIALDDRYLYAAWADMRKKPNSTVAGERSLYFARIPLTAFQQH